MIMMRLPRRLRELRAQRRLNGSTHYCLKIAGGDDDGGSGGR